MPFAYWLRRHSLEVQFWGYETGNISRLDHRRRRPARLRRQLRRGRRARPATRRSPLALWLARNHPETFATLGVMAIVVVAFPLGSAVGRHFGPRAADAVNALAVPLALALLGFAIARSANLFTVAACAFVVGSCLLRGAGHFPLLLKLGGPGAELRRPLAGRRRGDGARGRRCSAPARSASR